MNGVSYTRSAQLLTNLQVRGEDPRLSATGWDFLLRSADQQSESQRYSSAQNMVTPTEDVVSMQNFNTRLQPIEATSGYGYFVRVMWLAPDLESQYRERIDELVQCADEEGIQISDSSLKDIRSFVTTLARAGKLGIFLLDNGHFRTIQKQAVDDQVGLEFLGENRIKMTIIRRDPESKKMVADTRILESIWVAPSFLSRRFFF